MPALALQRPPVPALFNGLAGVESVLEGVLVTLRRPGSLRPAVHTAPTLALDRRRQARGTLSGARTAPRAEMHGQPLAALAPRTQ